MPVMAKLIEGCESPWGACVVVRNTFLSIDEPKEDLLRRRRKSEPFGLGCMCAEDIADDEDSSDDESQCSTDAGSISIFSDRVCQGVDCRESNEAEVVVKNTFLDVRIPREELRRKSVH